MPLDAIKITIQSTDIPGNWLSAEEANCIATSISNKNLTNFMNTIMEIVKIAAEEGRTSCSVSKGGSNEEIVHRALNFLRSLGYEVSNYNTSICLKW